MKIVAKIFKALFYLVVSTVIGFFVNKILENLYPKITFNANWFYNIIYKFFTFRISVLALLISVILIFLFYKLVCFIIIRNQNFRIIKATYGTDAKRVNFTKKLNDSIVDGKIFVQLTNSFVGSDPVHGVQKRAKIKYKLDKNIFDIDLIEGSIVQLPSNVPEHESVNLPS